MTKTSRGLLLILVLVIAFLIVDVVGGANRDIENRFEPIPLIPITMPAAEPVADSTPEPVVVTILASEVTPTSTPVAVPTVVPAPTQVQIASVPRTTKPDAENISSAPIVPGQESLFDALMLPFANEAQKRRAELTKQDPEFGKRVDPQLNEGRVNFLLFGYGESHEPPATEKAIVGSHTIVSYHIPSRRIDIISLTHDIRAPEIEREFLKRGFKSPAVRIDQAYSVGGFKLMRQTLENATGLSIDFQVTFKDSIMQGLVDSVFDGVMVDVPMAFDVHPFYLEGKKYDKGHFPKGLQRLNGRQVIQFIKTVPIAEGAYDKSLEHNVRKSLIFDGLLAAINKNYTDRLFWLRGSAFVTRELVSGGITYDFDPVSLVVNNIGSTTASIQRSLTKNKSDGALLPKIMQSKYIVDPAHGDGGVQWVSANAAVNPFTKKDIENGVYPSLDVEVPYTANPYGDLVTEYWTSVRQIVKTTLTSK
ncbi:MAG: LCP family protein [Chloroflexi bacterium]|nr:LCP family protein [Chloroflexota bacterium]